METTIDTADFLNLLKALPSGWENFFTVGRERVVTRAPGRLDLMGGIADYSGSLVLQLPIAHAAHAALQLRDDETVRFVSLAESPRAFSTDLACLGSMSYDAAREFFLRDAASHWAAYVAGAFVVLRQERGVAFERGANVLIRSAVPEGKGVSSSAALEVSVMQAIAAAYRIALDPREIAFLCQKVENLVAGAPCGVMDQMTSACGEADRLLALVCQPGELLDPVKLPAELAVWGIDSGIRHAVTGVDYGTVRTAAFIGYRILADLEGLPCDLISPGRVAIEDLRWRGYLANVTPAEFEESFAARLPGEMRGDQFLARYGGITDPVTTVLPDRIYPVFQATRHPIYENTRVHGFAAILQNWQGENDSVTLGEKMYESHASYSACGLGSAGTDELVRLVREAGPTQGVYGAKITGGGSGGTVAVLGRRDAGDAVHAIASEYRQLTGRPPLVLSGSSPGAAAFGCLRLS